MIRSHSRHALVLKALLLSFFAAFAPQGAAAQTSATVPVVMLSDIHFDPYHDPAKLSQLRAAPAAQWPTILNQPDSPTLAADTTALRAACKGRGVDTMWTLLQSSLAAAKAQQPSPLFVTLSGDLLSHEFDCRFDFLTPGATPADFSAFAQKTVEFVALQLRLTFPGIPVYLALGNNDSGCKDYRETPDSAFLRGTGRSFADGLANGRNRKALLRTFPTDGDYNIALPKPMQHARLIVLQNLFESKKYADCGAPESKAEVPDETNAKAQITWLRTQLASARKHHEHVWVMAHIPPGVDVYATFSKPRELCAGKPPDMFLSSEELTAALTDFADVVPLSIFAHSHMDEMRLFHSATGSGMVPAKLIPSISPVNGNNPAFLVAQVNPANAVLMDYTVFSGDNQTGLGQHWSPEYTYSATYAEPDFSASSVAMLTSAFLGDKSGTGDLSHAYESFFFVGDTGKRAMQMQFIWPAYTCSITQDREAAFRSCFCAVQP